MSALVRGAVGSYLSETAELNYAHTFLSTLSRPEHREVVGELAQRVTGEAVRALVTAGAAELAAARTAPAAAAAAARAASGASASPSRSRGSGDAAPRTPPPAARTALASSMGKGGGSGFGRRAFSMPSPPHGAFSLADGEPLPLNTPPPCTLCSSSSADMLGGCSDATHAAHRWLAGAAAASCGAPASYGAGSADGSSPEGGAASDGGGVGGGNGSGAAAAADSTWVATARLALSIAAQPEARALLRDVAGAAAGASVRAAITTLPSALCSMLPSMPFRRRAAAAAAAPPAQATPPTQQASQRGAAASRGATPLRRGMHTPVGGGVTGTPRARLTELDAEGRPLPRSASDSWCAGADSDGSPRSEAASQALCVSPAAGLTASARMQGALAMALVVHAFAFMPHAAARVGLYGP